MNYANLKTAILANPDCAQYVVTNDMPKDPNYFEKDSSIASVFNVASGTRLVERYENAIGIMCVDRFINGLRVFTPRCV